jgi:hypothetical protein
VWKNSSWDHSLRDVVETFLCPLPTFKILIHYHGIEWGRGTPTPIVMRALKILLADDHPLMLQGIRSVLERQLGWTVCGDAGNGREAVAMAKRLSPT